MVFNAERLRREMHAFAVSEEGLVTVEWVALAGAVIIGAIAVGWIVMRSLSSPANTIGTTVSSGTSSTY